MQNQSEVLNNFYQETKPTMAESISIIKEILFKVNPVHLRENIHTMLDAYLLYYENATQDEKFDMYGVFYTFNCALKETSPEKVIKDILISDDPERLLDRINTLLGVYLVYDENASQDEKIEMFNNVQALNIALRQMEHIDKKDIMA